MFTMAMDITTLKQPMPQAKHSLLLAAQMEHIPLTMSIRALMEAQAKFKFILTMMLQRQIMRDPVGVIPRQDRDLKG